MKPRPNSVELVALVERLRDAAHPSGKTRSASPCSSRRVRVLGDAHDLPDAREEERDEGQRLRPLLDHRADEARRLGVHEHRGADERAVDRDLARVVRDEEHAPVGHVSRCRGPRCGSSGGGASPTARAYLVHSRVEAEGSTPAAPSASGTRERRSSNSSPSRRLQGVVDGVVRRPASCRRSAAPGARRARARECRRARRAGRATERRRGGDRPRGRCGIGAEGTSDALWTPPGTLQRRYAPSVRSVRRGRRAPAPGRSHRGRGAVEPIPATSSSCAGSRGSATATASHVARRSSRETGTSPGPTPTRERELAERDGRPEAKAIVAARGGYGAMRIARAPAVGRVRASAPSGSSASAT